MKARGTGTGSTLIILVFSVLCLTIFSIISFTTASADNTMAKAAADMAKGYYHADTLAEYILSEILTSDVMPASIRGVDIITDGKTGMVMFSCPVSDRKELYVELNVYEDYFDIIKWQMRDTGEWTADTSLQVWPGE